MTNLKTITLVLFFFLTQAVFSSCNHKAETHTSEKDTSKNGRTDTSTNTRYGISDHGFTGDETKIVDTVFSLKEVKDWSVYLERETKNKRHIQLLISDTPTNKFPYYWISVGEDNGSMFVTHSNFFVHPKSLQILYLDTVNDDTLTLGKWRKSNGM
jgi:hypothetical protein